MANQSDQSTAAENPFAYREVDEVDAPIVTAAWSVSWPEWVVSSLLAVVSLVHAMFTVVSVFGIGRAGAVIFAVVNAALTWSCFRAAKAISVGRGWWFPAVYGAGVLAFAIAFGPSAGMYIVLTIAGIGFGSTILLGVRAFMRRRLWSS